jgi:hypothetical protein
LSIIVPNPDKKRKRNCKKGQSNPTALIVQDQIPKTCVDNKIFEYALITGSLVIESYCQLSCKSLFFPPHNVYRFQGH